MNRTPILLLTAVCALLTPPTPAEPIDECGYLMEDGTCICFERATHCSECIPTDLAALPGSLRYRPVRVSGTLVSCYQDCGGWYQTECLVGTEIAVCEPVDLGCGVLWGDDEEVCDATSASPTRGDP